ncbi:MAG: homocysteine S-methyltransferase family protein [Planctomycetota bacterium]
MPMDSRPVVLDAAMGTRLIGQGLDLATDDPCLWSLRRPETVLSVHRDDLKAGSQMLTSNSFGANSQWLAKFGLASQMKAINRAAVELARRAFAESGITGKVIGSIGPWALSEQSNAQEQVAALLDSGADLILFETCNLVQAKLAANWFGHEIQKPIWISIWNWGDQPEELAKELEQKNISNWGVNCISDIAQILDTFKQLNDHHLSATILKPSNINPLELVDLSLQCQSLGGLYFGGCCGTTSDHITGLSHLFRNPF